MNNEQKPTTYRSPLRERQKQQTTGIILDAVGSLIRQGGTTAVTIAEVARVAVVTERTVYRHFETRDVLLTAFWQRELQQRGGERVVDPRTPEELHANIIRLFTALDRDETFVRALLLAPESVAIRRETNERRFTHMIAFLQEFAPGLPPKDRRQAAAGIVSVSSVQSWMFMRDNCGLNGRQAGDAAALAVGMILEGAIRRGAELRESEADDQ